MTEKIIEINQDQYEKEVLNESLVVVDFYSTECPPCEALATKYDALSAVYGDDIKFIKIFRQGNREKAEELGINSSPTLLFYKDGELVGDKLSGGVKKADIITNLDGLLPETKVTELKAKMQPSVTECDIAILGGGPAGMTAAIYAAQAKLKTILIDPALTGGYVSTTHQVSNYPGFVDPQPGFMLSHFMSEQAVGAGAEYRVAVDVTSVDLDNKEIVVDELETIRAKKVIVATGSTPRPLGVKGEVEYRGDGISYCATCDAKYFEGKHAVVVGGGNSAVEEAMFIAKFADKVTIVHQFDELQANKTAQEKAMADPKIEFKLSHEPREFIKNDDGTMSVVVEDLKAKATKTIDSDGVFIFVGFIANVSQFDGKLKLDDYGYIDVDNLQHTSMKDIFAVGDVATKPFRQITIAVAEGTVAAIQANKELNE